MEQVHAAMAVTKNQRLGDETRKTSPTVGCRVRLGPWLLRMSLRQGHDAGELARNDSPWKNRTLWQSRSGLWRNLCLVNVATWIFWKASSWVKNLPWKAASVLCHNYFITRYYKFCVEHLKLESDELDVSFPRFWISVNFTDATGSVLVIFSNRTWLDDRTWHATKDSQILGQTAPIFSAGFARIFLKAPWHDLHWILTGCIKQSS